jgi:hypothetical protein
MNGTQNNFLENLREAIRENPLAAALIGGGALWLLIGNEKLKSAASKANAAAAPLADIGARNFRSAAPKFANSPPTAPDQDLDSLASQHVKKACETKSAVSDAVGRGWCDRTGWKKAHFRAGIWRWVMLPRKETLAPSSVSSAERQPLLLGAIGVAVGTVVASALTPRISKTNGLSLACNVKEDLNTRRGRRGRERPPTLKAEIDDMSANPERLQRAGRAGWTRSEKAKAVKNGAFTSYPPRYAGSRECIVRSPCTR